MVRTKKLTWGKMRIVDIARGHLILEAESKTVKIYGEALLRGCGSPDFVVYSNTIERWDFPNEREKFSDEYKFEIIEFLTAEFLRRNMTVEIE